MEPTKTISSKSDLAINGAPPAFADPLHVGRPNIGDTDDFLRLTQEMLERCWLTNNGPLVIELERRVADYLGVQHCVAMCNGTIALEVAIRALGLSGEVIVPSYTFVATAHALEWQGITPVFADIDPDTHNLDPESVRRRITPQTTGILGVHLWGRPAPTQELQAIADEHGLQLLFDAAHGFGCSHENTMIGNFGRAEILSFHATKFFNTFEGGAVVTNDAELADEIRLMRNFGFAGTDKVVTLGTNGKLTEVCAAMGLANLDQIDRLVEVNRLNYEAYRDRIAAIPGLDLLSFDEAEKNNYQYIVVEVSQDSPVSRDHIVEALHAENVLARKYFWPGCHRMEPYSSANSQAGDRLSNTEAVADRVIVLPTGTMVATSDIDVVTDVVRCIVDAA